MRLSILSMLLIVCLALAAYAAQTRQGGQDVPILTQRVNDFAQMLSRGEAIQLETILKQFEDSTSNQLVILTLSSLEGSDLEDFSIKVFEKNKIGQAKKDNGVLLLVVKGERLIRIEVGYGLEGVLTDALSSRIIEREIKPAFKEGEFFEGFLSGVSAIIQATAGEYQGNRRKTDSDSIPSIVYLLLLFFLFGWPAILRKSRFKNKGWSYHSGWGIGSGGWRGGGGFGGGWSGGGGFGGGGGASGRW